MPCTNHCSIDVVMEGGGIKGIGLVGALTALHDEGYKFVNMAGTSAGAIVASLLAAGYTTTELREIIGSTDFTQFFDSSPRWLPRRTRGVYNLVFHLGLYKGEDFYRWLESLLAMKGVNTFGDMKRGIPDKRQFYPLRVVASDITRGRLIVLPHDIAKYSNKDGTPMDPDRLPVALAVRMSMSIPGVFQPVRLPIYTGTDKTPECFIVDGGLLSNFPIELFDGPGMEERPTFGIRLNNPSKVPAAKFEVTGLLSYIKAMFLTAVEAPDAFYLDAHNFVRTIEVDSLGITATQFSLDAPDKRRLYQSGYDAAMIFLDAWDFDKWQGIFRNWSGISRMSLIRNAAAMVQRERRQ